MDITMLETSKCDISTGSTVLVEWELAMTQERKAEHIPLSEDVQNGDMDLQGGATIVKNSGGMGNVQGNTDRLVHRKPAWVTTYTVVDLVKSKRLFLTSLIMWFAW